MAERSRMDRYRYIRLETCLKVWMAPLSILYGPLYPYHSWDGPSIYMGMGPWGTGWEGPAQFYGSSGWEESDGRTPGGYDLAEHL